MVVEVVEVVEAVEGLDLQVGAEVVTGAGDGVGRTVRFGTQAGFVDGVKAENKA